MAEEVKKEEKVAPVKAAKAEVKAEAKVEAKAEVKPEPQEEPKVEVKAEPKASKPKEEPAPVEVAPVEEAKPVEDEVEALGKRGRKSAAEKAAELEYKKQVLADTYSVMINNEPWRAEVYREEYRAKLQELK